MWYIQKEGICDDIRLSMTIKDLLFGYQKGPQKFMAVFVRIILTSFKG